jgi:hypothetical protein
MMRWVGVLFVLLGIGSLGASAKAQGRMSHKTLVIEYEVATSGNVSFRLVNGDHVQHDGEIKFVPRGQKPAGRTVLVQVRRRWPNDGAESYDVGDAFQFRLGRDWKAKPIPCTPESPDSVVIVLHMASFAGTPQADAGAALGGKDGPQVVIDGSGGLIPPR